MKTLLSCLLLTWGALSFWFWNKQRTLCCGESLENVAGKAKYKSQELVLPSLPLNNIKSSDKSSTLTEEVAESATSPNKVLSDLVEEKDTKTNIVDSDADYVIYFKEGSSEWLEPSKIQVYVEGLSQRVKNSKEKIILTGYDDNTASPAESIEMGNRRTWRVRKAFKDDFVRRKLVKMISEGQEKPIAPNDTPDGRRKNRRVEIKIIKE